MFRKKSFIFYILLILLLYSFVHYLSAETDGARLEFKEESFDFGLVSNDTLLQHVFEFKNTGNDTLRILRVRSG